MPVKLDRHALEGAIVGGLFLSAGGSGTARRLRYLNIGQQALDYGDVAMRSVDEFEDSAQVFVATGVGAPGFAKAVTTLRDSIEAARLLIEATGVEPDCIMPGHVPGLNCWMQAAVFGVPVLDAATNGRGHPTVKMGGMGLTSEPATAVTQTGCGGAADDRLEIVVTGSMTKTSTIMRAAAIQNGGSLPASRGPFSIDLVRRGGAPGAMSFATRLGHAMLAAAEGRARAEAAAATLQGTIIAEGEVVSNSVSYDAGFDLGTVVVADPRGRVTLHVYNEFMAADRDGARLFTFPDMMGSLDRATGEVIAISEMQVGRPVLIMAASRKGFPVGASARDPNVFPEVEEKLGVQLARYLTE
jgi:DUF917 family protein